MSIEAREYSGPPPKEATEEERRAVVDAINAHYMNVYMKAQEDTKFEHVAAARLNALRILTAGVEIAVGRKIDNPEKAIPDDYLGDGSYDTKFVLLETGEEVTVREHIPLRFLRDFQREPYFQTLHDHSRPFKQSYPKGYYPSRVSLEAYFKAEESRRAGQIPNHRIDKIYYESAEWDLRERRELVLPVVVKPQEHLKK